MSKMNTFFDGMAVAMEALGCAQSLFSAGLSGDLTVQSTLQGHQRRLRPP